MYSEAPSNAEESEKLIKFLPMTLQAATVVIDANLRRTARTQRRAS